MYYAPSQTERGIRNATYAMLAFMITAAIGIAFILALPSLVNSLINSPPTSLDPTLIGTLIGIAAAGCAVLVVELIGAIFGLLGVIAINRGRHEFGPERDRRMDRSIIALILGIIVPFFGGFFAATGAIGMGLPVPSTTILAAGVSGAFAVAGALLVGLALLWLLDGLTTPMLHQRATIALAVGITAAVVSIVGSLAVTALVTWQAGQDLPIAYFVPSAVSSLVAIVSMALWYMTYRGVLGRFHSGELRPLPPTPMYPTPYATPYPPPYVPAPYVPPAQYPPQQPPGTPPAQP